MVRERAVMESRAVKEVLNAASLLLSAGPLDSFHNSAFT